MNFSCQRCSSPATIVSADNKPFCSPTCLQLAIGPEIDNVAAHKPAKKEKQRLLKVNGHGEVKVKNDMVRVRLEVEKNAKTVSELNEMLIADSSKLIDLLSKEKMIGRVLKIDTADLRITPKYESIKDTDSEEERYRKRTEVVSYEGVFPLSFETGVTNAGPLVDLVLKDNRTSSVKGLTYFVSENVSLPASKAALRLATIDARTQAEIVLTTLDRVIKDIVSIDIHSSGGKNSASDDEDSSESYSAYSNKRRMYKTSMQRTGTELLAPDTHIVAMVSLGITY